MSTKGKERAAYYDEEEGEEEGGIIEEEGQQEDGASPSSISGAAEAAKAVPIVKRPTHQGEPGSALLSRCTADAGLYLFVCTETWTPKHVRDRPRPPSKEEREAEIALLEAQARAGQNSNDPRARARIKVNITLRQFAVMLILGGLQPRRTVDHFGPLARWKLVR